MFLLVYTVVPLESLVHDEEGGRGSLILIVDEILGDGGLKKHQVSSLVK